MMTVSSNVWIIKLRLKHLLHSLIKNTEINKTVNKILFIQEITAITMMIIYEENELTSSNNTEIHETVEQK